MRITKRRGIRHAQQLGLPEDVALGLPRLVLHGNSSITLENHHGALEYGPGRVRMMTNLGTITIAGHNMTLKKMGRHDMMLRGEIHSVCFDGASEMSGACEDNGARGQTQSGKKTAQPARPGSSAPTQDGARPASSSRGASSPKPTNPFSSPKPSGPTNLFGAVKPTGPSYPFSSTKPSGPNYRPGAPTAPKGR